MTLPEHLGRRGQVDTARVPLRVLVVEDSEDDALLLLRELRRGGYEPVHQRVDTPEAMEKALSEATPWDVVLSDYYMPHFEAQKALAMLRRQGYDTPFIIVSGRIGEDVAVEAVKAGAHDYIMKDNMTRLCATVERGLKEAEARREREQAEEALRLSETRFRAMFEQFPLSIQFFAPDGHTLQVNRAWEQLFGIPPEAAKDFNPLEDPQLEEVRSYIRRGFGGEVLSIPPTLFDPRKVPGASSGQKDPIWVQGFICPVKDDDGNISEVIVVHQDITERKQAEEALRASEASYRAIFDSSNDAIFVQDLETGAILDVNQKACAMLEYSPEELRCLNIGDFSAGYPPYTTEDALRYMHKAAGGEPQVFEWLSKNRSGRLFWGEVTLKRATIGGHDRLLANVRDITERKEAEEALRHAHDEMETRVVERTAELAGTNAALQAEVDERKRAEQKLLQKTCELQAVFQALPDLYFRLDFEGTILDYQAGQQSNLYAPPQEFLGKRVQDVLPPEVGRQLEEAIQQVVEKDESACIEYSLELPEGAKDFEARLVGLRDEQIIIIVRDITDRKQAEAALQRSEEHFRSLIENTSDIITILDGQGVIRYQSPSAERVTGRSNEEMIGENAFDYFHPDDVAHTVAALAEVANNPGTTHSAEYRWRHKDGHYMIFESVGRTILPDSAEAGIVVNTRDVSERKQAEDELRFQKTLLEAQSEATIDGILVVSTDGKITSFNQRFVEMWEIPEEVISTRSDEAALQAVLDKLLDPQEFLARVAYLYEHPDEESRDEILLKDGRTFDRYSAPVKSTDGTYYGRVWYFRDVTEHKQAEAALRESEERLRFALEAGGMGAWEWDIGSGKVVWSPTLEELHGRAPGSFGGTFEEVLAEVHPDDRDLLTTSVRDAVEGGRKHDLEYRIVWPDGSVHWLAAKGRMVRDENGEPLRMVGVCTDVTGRKQAEEALRRAKEEAERAREEAEAANRAKSEFLSRMSHELRTPMNSILGFAQLLARKQLPPDQQRSVEHILKGGRHLLELINEVLDIARIETNRQQLSLEPVHVGNILQEALSLIQPLATQYDCRIEDNAPADSDYYVLADRQRLTQVLLNLLSNAVKYNRPGGSISLSCEKVSGEPKTGETTPDGKDAEAGEHLWIRVRDTGLGIAPEKMSRLFVAFDRLGAEQSDVEGTGLGLALSKRLIEAMGGALTAESTVGQGSTFAVVLALVDSPLERLERSGRDAATPGETAAPEISSTLLYIEDNLANLGLVETILSERPGITLLSALQGRIGLDLAREHRPDLILLDLHLPDIAGDEVLKELQSQPHTRDIPVIVVSADVTPGRVERLMQAGANGYLTKPLDVEQFLETIDETLREK